MPQVKREKSRPRRGASRAQKRVKREPETVGPSRAPSRANIPPTLIRTPSSLDSATSNPPDPNFVNNGTPPQPQGIPDPAYILTEIENYASTQAPDRILPRIHSLPRLRPLEFAITVAHGKPVTFHSQINQNAALTYSRGREIVGANVCVRCTAGKGTYQKCVVLEEFNKGSCANCVINCYGHKCSFRTSPPLPPGGTEPARVTFNSAAHTAQQEAQQANQQAAPQEPPQTPRATGPSSTNVANNPNTPGAGNTPRVSLRMNLKSGQFIPPTLPRPELQHSSQSQPQLRAASRVISCKILSNRPSTPIRSVQTQPSSILKPYPRPQEAPSSAALSSSSHNPTATKSSVRLVHAGSNLSAGPSAATPTQPNTPHSITKARDRLLQRRYLELAELVKDYRRDMEARWEKIDEAMGALGQELIG